MRDVLRSYCDTARPPHFYKSVRGSKSTMRRSARQVRKPAHTVSRHAGEPSPVLPLSARGAAIWEILIAILRNENRLYVDQSFALEGLVDALETRLDYRADIRAKGRVTRRLAHDGVVRETMRCTATHLSLINKDCCRWLRALGLTPVAIRNVLK